jgi:integrase
MPLKLIPPRKGKSPNWTIRGTHLRVYVDESCRTDRKPLARKIRDERERAIESGEWPPKVEPVARADLSTFIGAAVNYMETGHSRRYIAALIAHFGETPIDEIDQATIDAAAIAMHPNVTPATRNCYVYTPMSAILHHVGRQIVIKRPKGAKGRVVTDSLSPDDAFAIIRAAETFDPEYAVLLLFLLYTGVRIGEALALTWPEVRLHEHRAWVRTSKNGDPRELQLREDLCALLRARQKDTGRVFRFRQGGWLKWKLLTARMLACGLAAPVRPKRGHRRMVQPHRLSWVNHHSFCHTWATWMRRYGGLDEIGLVATNRWKDARSAKRYAHAVAREEWSQVEALPSVENPWKKASGGDK